MNTKLALTCWAVLIGGSMTSLSYGTAARPTDASGAAGIGAAGIGASGATGITLARTMRHASKDQVSTMAFSRDGKILLEERMSAWRT